MPDLSEQISSIDVDVCSRRWVHQRRRTPVSTSHVIINIDSIFYPVRSSNAPIESWSLVSPVSCRTNFAPEAYWWERVIAHVMIISINPSISSMFVHRHGGDQQLRVQKKTLIGRELFYSWWNAPRKREQARWVTFCGGKILSKN